MTQLRAALTQAIRFARCQNVQKIIYHIYHLSLRLKKRLYICQTVQSAEAEVKPQN